MIEQPINLPVFEQEKSTKLTFKNLSPVSFNARSLY